MGLSMKGGRQHSACSLARQGGVTRLFWFSATPPRGVWADNMLAVCLTGQLRWPALTLAMLHQFVLRSIPLSRRYFVGPADESYQRGEPLLDKLDFPRAARCAYDPSISWEWRSSNNGVDAPFELHAKRPCITGDARRRPKLRFDVSRLPVFRQCQLHRLFRRMPSPVGLDASATSRYDRVRSRPCASAISLVLQLWQCAQCVQLVRAAEDAAPGTLYHSSVLRLRSDIFYFVPVTLPRLPATTSAWFSTMEDSCDIEHATHQVHSTRKRMGRFIQDWMLYVSRAALDVLSLPLQILLQFGRDAAATSKSGAYQERWYIYHPFPHALETQFPNASKHCIPVSNGTFYGILRANAGARCYLVNARLPTCMWHKRRRAVCRHWAPGRVWKLVTPSDRRSFASSIYFGGRLLEEMDRGIRDCFGLTANASCPRLVGDQSIFVGENDHCLEPLTLLEAGALRDAAAIAAAETCKARKALRSPALAGYDCFDARLQRLQDDPPERVRRWVPWLSASPGRVVRVDKRVHV